MNKIKPYKQYSPEFKREALKRASAEGITDKEAGIKNYRSETRSRKIKQERDFLKEAAIYFAKDSK